ncbi:MAG: hypothetical protein HY270_24350 [Deltaproteobacteria bacterium]|nr:hypothetical protein [Deltaproteobacteria bacterium]
MRMMKGYWGLRTLAIAALGLLTFASNASAQETHDVSINYSGSVLIWPKVIWDGTHDTIIQVANTGNPLVQAHCFYINAAPRNPSLPPSVTNPPQWVETDFDIVLTRQQPTHWVASSGRRTQSDGFGVDGSGFDPGLIPPVPFGFQGELKCYQTDDSGSPLPGNRLKGEATLRTDTGDVSTYNAIALSGNAGLSGGQIGTVLDLNLTDGNPGGEYSACPDTLIFNHFAYGALDPMLNPSLVNTATLGGAGACSGNNCTITTTLTMVPCSQDLENGIPGSVTVGFLIYDEFETHLSASTTVTCWFNLPLNQIAPAGPNNPFTPGALGGSFVRHTRIRPVPGNGGVLGIAEETRTTSAGNTAVAAYNLQIQGNRFDGATQGENDAPAPGVTDQIAIPIE